jgi:protein-L-isoaspartate(D-aspartate) O-methyltransferase
VTTDRHDEAAIAANRRYYAEELRAICNLRTPGLFEAFASVPRERFLPPGPWMIRGVDTFMDKASGYQQTPDDSPQHLYHNVVVSIDATRELNNGHPSTLAYWLETLAPRPGERAVHIGCGPGYYTAIFAEVLGPSGHLTAIEVDPRLAADARRNLAPWPQVTVVEGDASELEPASADIVFLNAGATHPRDTWLDALRPNGRLLLPLTFEPVPGAPGKGGVVRVLWREGRYEARFVTMVAIYPCAGARDPEMNRTLMQAFMKGGFEKVRSLHRDAHEASPTCWLHGTGWCLRTDP